VETKRSKSAILPASLIGALTGALVAGVDHRHLRAFLLSASDRAVLSYWPCLLAAMTGWIVFSVYWEIAAKNAANARQSESKASRAVHVFLTNAALPLVILPARGPGRFLPISLTIIGAGLLIEAAGLCLTIWSRRHLGRNWSGEISIKEDQELIRSGPYRRLRHPIYTGLLAMYAGTAVVTGEWLGVLGMAIAVFAYWRKIRLEEANLHLAFGADYDAYRRITWALVPGLF
jgi:protein-S-isoprenylcysteine O-methyltransferase Ste14